VDTWVLFTTNKDPICCMPGETGTNAAADENYGHCIASGLSVPQASMATLVCSIASSKSLGLRRLQIGSGDATAPATLPAGYSTASGSSPAKSTSAAGAAAGGQTTHGQATRAATGATATVTVKSGAGTTGITPLQHLAVLFCCVMVGY
jgi:hypothetical protein